MIRMVTRLGNLPLYHRHDTFLVRIVCGQHKMVPQHLRSYFLSSVTLDKETSISSQILQRPDQLQLQPQRPPQVPFRSSLQNTTEDEVTILHKTIRSIQCTEDLLQFFENLTSTDESTVGVALSYLFVLCKHEKSASVKKDILNSVGMQKICKMLRIRGRTMDANSLISAAKVLVFLNAPPSNLTLQIVFKLLSKQANSFSLREISYLHFLLDKTTPNPLVSSLQLALPIVFESQLPIQIEKDNVNSLVDHLNYAAGYGISYNTIKIIIDALVDRCEELTPKQSLNLLNVLSMMEKSSQFGNINELMTACFTKATSSMEKFTTYEISTTISKLAKKVNNGKALTTPFYNEAFTEGVCSEIVKRKDDKLTAAYLAKSISLMRHVNIEFMDYITELLVDDPSILLNSDHLYLSIIRAFSMTNYKPEKFEVLQPILIEHPALTKDLGPQGISIASDLLALGILPHSLIVKIFSEDYFTRLDAFVKNNSPYQLMLVRNAIMLFHPSYEGPFPPVSMVQKWKNILFGLPKIYPLKGALESGFGGENYVMNGVFHEGCHIDHGIIMRKGGFPVAVNVGTEPKLMSDLQLPADSVILLLKVFMEESYANNTARMRGTNALELKIIEQFGHPVIPVDITRWKQLQDYEKIPFLMHRVRDKLEKSWSQPSGI